MPQTPVDINGDEPPITGRRCQEIVAIEHWYEGELNDQAAVVFLCFDDRWHRLYFDFGIVFWRADAAGPTGLVDPEHREFCPVDLGAQFGFRGRVLAGISYDRLADDGAAVLLRSDGGEVLAFRSLDDRTSYAVSPAV